jgi:hypothetical protein
VERRSAATEVSTGREEERLIVNDRQRVLLNNRITEYSALYRHRIFGVGQIVGLYRIFGIFFTEYRTFLPKTEYSKFWTKNAFSVGLYPKKVGTNKNKGFLVFRKFLGL